MLWWPFAWFPYFYSDCQWPFCGNKRHGKKKYQNTQSLCWFCRNVFSFITKPLTLAILTYYFMQFIDSIWYLVKPNHVWKCKVEVGCFWHPCLDILFMGVQWNEMKLTQNGTKFFLKEYFYPFFFDLPFHKNVLPFLLFSSFWSSVLWYSVKFFTTALKTSQNFSNWSH